MVYFHTAKPVWPRGLQNEKNVTVGLYAAVRPEGGVLTLRVACSGPYRVFVNGAFVAVGPARCGAGHFRVDTIELPAAPLCHVAVEAVNYAVNSFEWLDQPGFIQAELTVGDTVAAATGSGGWDGYRLTSRVQKVPRFSYQRPFGEAYRMDATAQSWRVGDPGTGVSYVPWEQTEEKDLLPRGIAPYTYPAVIPAYSVSRGTFAYPCPPAELRRDRSLRIEDPDCGLLKGYPVPELEWDISADAQSLRCDPPAGEATPFGGTVALADGEYEILRMPCEKTGYIACNIHCDDDATVWFFVDENLSDSGLVDPLSMECLNAIPLALEAGDYDFQAVEALGFRFLQIACIGGPVTVTDLRLVESVCPYPITAVYSDPDEKRQAIFRAACESFRQNAVDVFMDCPTRERAGWLCDSWFTARTEKALTGGNAVERNFLENFAVPDSFPYLPEGIVPMCYPSDHNCGQFIPNWAMWLVLEVEDHVRRTGDRTAANILRRRLEGIADYFTRFENEDGLLEKLESWVFLEWSHANELVQDINFPTNMLYARMLDALDHLYHGKDRAGISYADKAARLREVIRRRSFNGTFFTDNEVYKEGCPVSSGEITETCQYYAFFTDVATPQTYPALWHTLCTEFGPHRVERGLHPAVAPANAFIGNYLRLETFRRYGLWDQLLDEMEGYFYYMAERTGTLWENATDYASCNHGFASYAAVLLLEAEAAEALR